jgi:hypothetical protein
MDQIGHLLCSIWSAALEMAWQSTWMVSNMLFKFKMKKILLNRIYLRRPFSII